MVINSSGEVEEVNHYYPFGGLFSTSSSVQPYKYNGKELDTANGLNWYDYGARHYDAALGRWHVVDPLAEKYYSTSPYAYCLNNSVKYVDPDGKKIVIGSWLGRVLAFFGVDNYEARVQRDIAQLKKDDSEVANMIKRLEDSKYTIEIAPVNPTLTQNTDRNYTLPNYRNRELKQGATVGYNPDNSKTIQGDTRDARIGLVHELGHADDLIQGKGVNFDSRKARQGDKEEQSKGIKNERHAIEMENIIRKIENLGERNPEEYYNYINNLLNR